MSIELVDEANDLRLQNCYYYKTLSRDRELNNPLQPFFKRG